MIAADDGPVRYEKNPMPRNLFSLLCLVLAVAPPAAAQTSSEIHLRPPVPGCPQCAVWLEYESVILKADQEVAPLRHGVLYFYHSKDPAIIERLIRFAHERTYLADLLATDAGVREHLGEACRHREYAADPIELEISIGAHGFFALLLAGDEETLRKLRVDAQLAVKDKIPAWF
jgi:hypothetical protein